ncbi:glycosyltransferase family 39 protein [Paracoccus sp. Z118]|uniref:ArnT family glycosyltransferase n=1 Tax=Paracoccus sp. Z118 TaxID=2851017 RepID=UPI001C2BE59A|nr:glycosyltransferase family 39 protein [Paracoccus sp. Z118]MBV0893367.1 glycosyltransferase family 39 protein [Paracoccus sp. Z118]
MSSPNAWNGASTEARSAPHQGSRTRRLGSYGTLLLVGMGLRILWAIAVPMLPVSDSWAYHQFARTLVDHGVYGWSATEPTAYWAVGTSALVAFTYLFTDSYAGVVILNLIAGFMILTLTHHLAARWFGDRIAILALALVVFWPNLIFFTTVLSSELFFIAGTLAGLIFWQRQTGNPMVNLLLAGVIWGLTSYIRPVILLVPLTLALVDLARGPRRFVVSAMQAGIAMLLILLVAAPWTIRNQQVLGAPVMISTNFGPNLWMGNNPASNGGYMELPSEVEHMTEIERSEYLKEEAKQFMREDPGAAIRLLGLKLVRLNIRETVGVVWNEENLRALVGDKGVTGAKLLATGYWYLLLIGALAGIAVIWRRNGIVAAFFNPPVALCGYFTSLHVIVVADDRYHMPSSPFIAMMAAVALHALLSRPAVQFPQDKAAA